MTSNVIRFPGKPRTNPDTQQPKADSPEPKPTGEEESDVTDAILKRLQDRIETEGLANTLKQLTRFSRTMDQTLNQIPEAFKQMYQTAQTQQWVTRESKKIAEEQVKDMDCAAIMKFIQTPDNLQGLQTKPALTIALYEKLLALLKKEF